MGSFEDHLLTCSLCSDIKVTYLFKQTMWAGNYYEKASKSNPSDVIGSLESGLIWHNEYSTLQNCIEIWSCRGPPPTPPSSPIILDQMTTEKWTKSIFWKYKLFLPRSKHTSLTHDITFQLEKPGKIHNCQVQFNTKGQGWVIKKRFNLLHEEKREGF